MYVEDGLRLRLTVALEEPPLQSYIAFPIPSEVPDSVIEPYFASYGCVTKISHLRFKQTKFGVYNDKKNRVFSELKKQVPRYMNIMEFHIQVIEVDSFSKTPLNQVT